jgi:RNA polymerase sigma-70 factor (ECF subfamily)
MADESKSSVKTRPSLLKRLKTGDDNDSWEQFYRSYGKLVRDFAIRAGLTDTEADEVVQETAIGVARHLPDFSYDPKVCRFKTWLLNQSSWRVKDQLRKRRHSALAAGQRSTGSNRGLGDLHDDEDRTSTAERVADPASVDVDGLFDREWCNYLLTAALERVRHRFSLKQLQIFDLTAFKQWPAAEVARCLGVTIANVYVTKHRIATAVKKEAAKLELELDASICRASRSADPC